MNKKKENLKRASRKIILGIAAIIFLYIFIPILINTDFSNKTYAIESPTRAYRDFEYHVSNNKVYLERYTGNEKMQLFQAKLKE